MGKFNFKIAVDLTPLQPGGQNGGAKVLVLSLLKEWQEIGTNYQFLLLTAPWNHQELIEYESSNIKCLLMAELGQESNSLFGNNQIGFLKNLYSTLNKLQNKFSKFHSKSLLEKHKVSLLFCPFSAPTYAQKNIPLVAIIHDLQHLDYPFFFTDIERENRTNFLNNLMKEANHLICVSDFTRLSFIKYFNADTKIHQITVIPNSIHKRWKNSSKTSANKTLEEIGLIENKYAFYPANYWQHKNHRMLLAAYNLYKKNFSDHSLDLVFTGALKNEESNLREAVKRMGISDHVHFLGFLDEDALAYIWERCKCLIFPSLYEGFGIPVLEAMAFGKPVLASKVCSLPEVGGDAVLYFDPRNPIEVAEYLGRITNDTLLCKKLINQGYERLKSFDQKEMATQYLQVFEESVKNFQNHDVTYVTGIYSDKWSKPTFYVNLGSNLSQGDLVLTVEVPSFYPASQAKVILKSRKRRKTVFCVPGTTQQIVWPIDINSSQQRLTIQIKPSFVPCNLHLNSDTRQLGLLIQGCQLKFVDGTSYSVLL